MEDLYESGGCLREEILNMETLNHDYEIEDREQKIIMNYSLIEEHRRTIQPTREWDEDLYHVTMRLTSWKNY